MNFHNECMQMWISQCSGNPTCPACRQEWHEGCKREKKRGMGYEGILIWKDCRGRVGLGIQALIAHMTDDDCRVLSNDDCLIYRLSLSCNENIFRPLNFMEYLSKKLELFCSAE